MLFICISINSFSKGTTNSDTVSAPLKCSCGGNDQAPLGIMTDHVHGKGEWMASYTFMDMTMQGNRMGTKKISDDVIGQNYMMIPKKMSMQMHMVMIMYGISDKVTLMGMTGYAANSMSMNISPLIFTNMNMTGMAGSNNSAMVSRSSGLTDTKIFALFSLLNTNRSRLIASIGANLPTGSTNLTGPTMFGVNHRLDYDMQTGTGTYGFLPSFTFVSATANLSWGGQAGANINMGMNKQGYRLGNIYNATAWASYQFFPFMSASLRAEDVITGKIKGYDGRISEFMYNDPSADSHNYGGQRASIYAGLNFSIKPLKGFHFLCEYGIPVYENINGPQMSVHANLLAGVQYSF
jgi:hypothetical protein